MAHRRRSTRIAALSALRLALAALAAAGLAGCAGQQAAGLTAPQGLRIVALAADPDTVAIGAQSVLTAQVENPGGGELTYTWAAYQGPIVAQGPRALYYGSVCCTGTDQVVLQVRDARGEQDTKLITMTVYPIAVPSAGD
jgi:Flp pilus assembly protein TadG